MAKPVFISYCRRTSAERALQLAMELGDLAFLDKRDLEALADFPDELFEAILGAKLIVVLADRDYFGSFYCRLELNLALTPYRQSADLGSLRHIFAAAGGAGLFLDPLPPLLRKTNWPGSEVGDHVRRRVANIDRPLRDSLSEAVWRGSRDEMHEVSSNPPPCSVVQVPHAGSCFDVASLGHRFVGRATALSEVHDLLYPSRNSRQEVARIAAVTTTLTALGGVGKTTLAREYVWRYGPLFYAALFWLDCEAADMYAQYHRVLDALVGPLPSVEDLRKQKLDLRPDLGRALAKAATESQLPILVVLDNVPESKPPRLLTEFCPALDVVTTLVTSRMRMPALREVQVPVMSDEAARLLLQMDLPNEAKGSLTPEEWGLICRWVGNLPLALEILNASMHVVEHPREVYALARAAVDTTGPLDERADALGLGRSISEALKYSFRLLSPGAQSTALTLAHLAPAPIPLFLLEALCPEATLAVRTELGMRNFLTGRSEGSVGQFHRTLADFLLSQGTAGGAENEDAVAWALSGFLGTVDPGDDLRAVVIHAERLLARAPLNLGLIGQLGYAYMELARLPEARIRTEQALALAHAALTEDHAATQTFVHNLAMLELSDGRVQRSIDLNREVLEWRRRRLPTGHLDTLRSMNNLALGYSRKGELEVALQLNQDLLELRRRHLGDLHPDTLSTLIHLAGNLLSLGRTAAAREPLEEACRGHAIIHPGDHHQKFLALSTLGQFARDAGELERSRQLHEEALAGLIRVLGERHPETLDARGSLAMTLWDLGMTSEAQAVREEILDIVRSTPGADFGLLFHSVAALGDTLSRQGYIEQALALQRQVLADCERTLGDNHPNTLRSRGNLAMTLLRSGRGDEARPLQESVLEAHRRILGDRHPDTLTSISNLAETLRGSGDYEAAEALQREALAASETVHGPAHSITLTAINNLALTLQMSGRLEEARVFHESELRACRRVLGDRHPDTLVSIGNLASLMSRLGEHGSGARLWEELFTARRERLGKDHPDTLRAQFHWSDTVRRQGRSQKADRLLRDFYHTLISQPLDQLPEDLQEMRGVLTLNTFGSLAAGGGQ